MEKEKKDLTEKECQKILDRIVEAKALIGLAKLELEEIILEKRPTRYHIARAMSDLDEHLKEMLIFAFRKNYTINNKFKGVLR